jgi:hypothetical protein
VTLLCNSISLACYFHSPALMDINQIILCDDDSVYLPATGTGARARDDSCYSHILQVEVFYEQIALFLACSRDVRRNRVREREGSVEEKWMAK